MNPSVFGLWAIHRPFASKARIVRQIESTAKIMKIHAEPVPRFDRFVLTAMIEPDVHFETIFPADRFAAIDQVGGWAMSCKRVEKLKG